LDFSLT